MFKHENMPYDNNILHKEKNGIQTSVSNGDLMGKKEHWVQSLLVLVSEWKMFNTIKKIGICNQGNTLIYYITQTMDYFAVCTGW